MVGKLSEEMFDEGINIHVEKEFNTRILNNVVITKASIIKLLFEHSE